MAQSRSTGTAPRLSLLRLVASLTMALAAVSPARGDEFTTRAAADFKGVAQDKRTDLVILPLLASMDPVPAVLRTQERAALLGSSGPSWKDCADWAQKPGQRAVIEALAKVTKDDDRQKTYAFAQPYGVEGVETDLIAKGLYTELGDPPLLSAAKHLYLPAFENAGILAHVEASRLLAAGSAGDGAKVMSDWLFFCRQIADRPFLKEKRWAMVSMRLALERLRDLAYQDFRAEKHTLDPAGVAEVVKRLRDRRGPLSIDRITLPEGEFIAREQLYSAILLDDAGPNPQSFATTMARIASADRPLQLFGAAAFWESARTQHANTRDSRAMLDGLRTDFNRRWALDPFDRALGQISEFRKRVATTSKFATLQVGLNEIEPLFALRQQLTCEAAGTRMGLACYGFFLRQKSMPQTLASPRPEFIDRTDKDPYSRRGAEMEYFVPTRDTPKGPNGEDKPHTITVYPPDPLPSFQVKLGADQFVVYSVGLDDDKGWAQNAVQARSGVPGDYLLFPPVLSLTRQRLIETNQLK